MSIFHLFQVLLSSSVYLFTWLFRLCRNSDSWRRLLSRDRLVLWLHSRGGLCLPLLATENLSHIDIIAQHHHTQHGTGNLSHPTETPEDEKG